MTAAEVAVILGIFLTSLHMCRDVRKIPNITATSAAVIRAPPIQE